MMQWLSSHTQWIDMDYSPMMPKLEEISSLVTCSLCGGYLIDATTINRCLHSFCRACIVTYLQVRKVCPTCGISLHPVYPRFNLRRDKVLQRIVFKIIPGLYQWEMKRRMQFVERLHRTVTKKKRSEMNSESVIYCETDLFSISLHYGLEKASTRVLPVTTEVIIEHSQQPPHPARLTTYLQCPARITVRIVKKFVRLKFEVGPSFAVELFSVSGERIDDHYTLMDIAYVFTERKVGALQLHYLVVNRSSLHVPPPSPMLVPPSAIGDSCTMPPKRKRGRPPRRHSLVADCASEASQQHHGTVVDEFDKNENEVPIVSRKHSAEESSRQQSAGLLPSSSSLGTETSAALVSPPAKIPCRHLEQTTRKDTTGDEDVTVESRLSGDDTSSTVGCTSTCLSVDQRQCNDAADDERSDSRTPHYPYQPMIWVNPFFNSVLTNGGLVCPCDTLDSSVFPNIQLVGLLATPSFATEGAKTDSDASYGAAIGITSDHSQVYYPGFYGCLVSQEGDLSHAASEGNPVCCITDFTSETSASEAVALKADRASHWRVRHETVEMQHFEALVSDLPQLAMISNSPENDRYVGIVDSSNATTVMSCESNKLQTVRQCSQNSESMSVESNSAFVFVNDMVPATATLVDVAELVEVSGIPTESTDLGIVADRATITKPDVIASNIPRYLFPDAQQQALIESSSIAVSSSHDNPVPSEISLRRDSDAAKDAADIAVAGVSCSSLAAHHKSDSQLSACSSVLATSSSVSPRLSTNDEVGDGCCSSSVVERPVECTVLTQESFSEPFLLQSAALSTAVVASSSGLSERCSPIEPAV